MVLKRVALALVATVIDCNVLVRDTIIGCIPSKINLGVIDAGVRGILTLIFDDAPVSDMLL